MDGSDPTYWPPLKSPHNSDHHSFRLSERVLVRLHGVVGSDSGFSTSLQGSFLRLPKRIKSPFQNQSAAARGSTSPLRVAVMILALEVNSGSVAPQASVTRMTRRLNSALENLTELLTAISNEYIVALA
jgi:hypothetical protein